MKKFLSLFLLFIFSWSWVFAQDNASYFAEIFDSSMPVTTTSTHKYTSSEAFLKDYGKTCEVATDGCNTVQIWNGQLWATTLMYCEDIYWPKGQENWSCIKEVGKLSVNDQNQYDTFKKRLPPSHQNQVNAFMVQYKNKLKSYSTVRQNQITQKAIGILENAIFDIMMKYPQDKALPKKVNDVYMMLSLLKLELMKL